MANTRLSFTLILVINFVYSTSDSLGTLRFVNLIFRHGERSPVHIYPSNPYTVDYWPQKALAWQTPKGAQHSYELGKYIRNRYDGFLNETYVHDEVKIWTSDVFRTVMSASAFVDGLFRSTGDQALRENVTGPIVPVMAVAQRSEDNLIRLSKHCPEKDKLWYQAFQLSEAAKQIEEEYRNVFRFLENVTGIEDIHFGSSSFNLVDCLVCQEAQGFPLPEWYNGSVKDALLRINDLLFQYTSEGDQLKRIMGGPLLERCTQTMKSKQVPGIYKEKFHIYSAHDITVSSLLTAMDIFDGKRPPFNSAILMELHEMSTNNYSVQILYKKGGLSEAAPVTRLIKGCESDMCPFETFVEATKGGIPENWDEECGITGITETPQCTTEAIRPNIAPPSAVITWLETIVMVLTIRVAV